MNLLDVQDKLKNLSEQQLVQEMQNPTGTAPQFLVLTEIQRRKRMRDEFQSQQAQAPQTTVAQDAVAAAGVPQQVAGQMAQAMAPQTDMTQNTGIMSIPPQAPAQPEQPQAMAAGGMVRKMADGRAVYSDPAIIAMANRLGMSVDEYLRTLGADANKVRQQAEARASRSRMLGTEPSGISAIPSQTDLDRRYIESLRTGDRFPVSGFSQPGPDDILGTSSVDPTMAPPARPEFPYDHGMNTRDEAVSAATTKGGRDGFIDALIATGQPNINPDALSYQFTARGDNGAGPSFGVRGRDPMTQDEIMAASQANMAASQAKLADAVEGGSPWSSLVDYFMSDDAEAPQGSPIGLNRADAYKAARAKDAAAIKAAALQNGPAFEDTGRTPLNPWMERTAALQAAENATPASPAAEDSGSIWDIFSGDAMSPGMVAGAGGVPSRTDMPPPAPRNRDRDRQDITGDIKSAENSPEAKAAADAKTAEVAAKAAADEAAAADKAAGSGGAGGVGGVGVAASGPQTDYEKAMADALARADKRANQDKWLALAQAGMAIMSSNSPSLLGALGEGGAKGLEQFQSTRDAAEKDRMGILAAQYQMGMDKQKMALEQASLAARSAGSSGGLKTKDLLDFYNDNLKSAQAALADAMVSGSPEMQMQAQQDYEQARLERQAVLAQLGLIKAPAAPTTTVRDVTQ